MAKGRQAAADAGGPDGNAHNRIEVVYGVFFLRCRRLYAANILKVLKRVMPVVFERHHPEMLAAERGAVAAVAAARLFQL